MMIEKIFFAWNDKDNDSSVKLGDRIDNLFGQGYIINSGEKHSSYKLSKDKSIWINSKNNFVNSIFFTGNSVDDFLGLDSFSFEYPATQSVITFLSKKYERLPFETIEEVKESYSGDLLYLVFRDYIPFSAFLMRLKK